MTIADATAAINRACARHKEALNAYHRARRGKALNDASLELEDAIAQIERAYAMMREAIVAELDRRNAEEQGNTPAST